jgi:hypothetical protein
LLIQRTTSTTAAISSPQRSPAAPTRGITWVEPRSAKQATGSACYIPSKDKPAVPSISAITSLIHHSNLCLLRAVLLKTSIVVRTQGCRLDAMESRAKGRRATVRMGRLVIVGVGNEHDYMDCSSDVRYEGFTGGQGVRMVNLVGLYQTGR